ncbi:uncharacterized protein LOC110092055 isoform X2 [Dendrobium catenatum]|uniref:uncharacterized protein LOC110092055 isoform X2 n=1 Tax=Dendrobium catenatum TaxID=906689 RepID=UPI0009F1BE8E|nr:uncharacterized protein LOC110092055 isoform X2 [Dendrobium catenatum]
MEYAIAAKRIGRILDHVSGCEGVPSPSSHLTAMNCSSTLNSMARRYTDRTIITPEDSVSQAGYMQHASVKENQEEPLFCRRAWENTNIPDSGNVHLLKQDSTSSSIEALKFSGTNRGKLEEELVYSKTSRPSISDGLVWSPRIDVAESSSSYVIIAELPGVNINGIRVEVDNHKLTITGKRVMQQQWRVMNSSGDSNLTYHRKEILQGPYEVIWPLPKDVNRDRISAEFVDGFLQILVPKI